MHLQPTPTGAGCIRQREAAGYQQDQKYQGRYSTDRSSSDLQLLWQYQDLLRD